MRENTAKAKLKSGQAVIGPIIGFTSPQLVEIAGRAGFDVVLIDCELRPTGIVAPRSPGLPEDASRRS